jgi:hypothetical protein
MKSNGREQALAKNPATSTPKSLVYRKPHHTVLDIVNQNWQQQADFPLLTMKKVSNLTPPLHPVTSMHLASQLLLLS